MPTTEVTDPMLLDTTGQDIVTKLQDIATALAANRPLPSGTTPLMDGTATPGTETAYARGDHRHPENTNKVDKTTKVNGYALSADVTLTAGDIGYDGTDSGLLAEDTKGAIDELAGLLFEAPTQDGTYLLQCTVVDGEFEYEWVSAS